MRSILCPADNAPTLDDRVETALALARATGGHVTFQIATPFAQMALWEPFGGAALSAVAINEVRAEDEKLAAALDARLARQDVAFDVTVVDVGRVEGLAAASRFADVIVASLDDPALEEVALEVRCPVLALPQGAPKLAFDAPVLVAWDGGYESANALRASLPLLALAPAVHILTVREKSEDFPASEAASYLSRHGIHAEVREAEPNGTIAFTIEETALRLGAGLVVMGLFGKSRLRELLLGGVSRSMLDRSRIPLLLAH
ncbi:universal stress protein [Novosphingobium huizhouense]|uniref:universal stress protein n=1 Tax=Novosphingobium huizhouense TaxID=2866625 RepID=UPI001CD8C14C|nr:universal stress protein [Novosphingobium huizhouense]